MNKTIYHIDGKTTQNSSNKETISNDFELLQTDYRFLLGYTWGQKELKIDFKIIKSLKQVVGIVFLGLSCVLQDWTNEEIVWVPTRANNFWRGHLAQWGRCHLAHPHPVSECLGSSPWSKFQLPADTYPGKQQVIDQVLESLPPTGKTQTGFQVSGFSLSWPWLS